MSQQKRFLGTKNTINLLKHSGPSAVESRPLWERLVETSFCAMMQNPVYADCTHAEIIQEAKLMADEVVNGSRERFEANTNPFDDVNPTTGVFGALPSKVSEA